MATTKTIKITSPKKIFTFQDETALEAVIAEWVAAGKRAGIERTPSQFHRQAARLLIQQQFPKGSPFAKKL